MSSTSLTPGATRLGRILDCISERNAGISYWLTPLLGVVALICCTLFAWSWVWLLPGIAAASVAATGQISHIRWLRQSRNRDDALAAGLYTDTVRSHHVFADQFADIARASTGTAEMTPKKRQAEFKAVAKQVVDAIVRVFAFKGLRAVVYEVANNEQSMQKVIQGSLGSARMRSHSCWARTVGTRRLRCCKRLRHCLLLTLRMRPPIHGRDRATGTTLLSRARSFLRLGDMGYSRWTPQRPTI